jgi:hypothetical protein
MLTKKTITMDITDEADLVRYGSSTMPFPLMRKQAIYNMIKTPYQKGGMYHMIGYALLSLANEMEAFQTKDYDYYAITENFAANREAHNYKSLVVDTAITVSILANTFEAGDTFAIQQQSADILTIEPGLGMTLTGTTETSQENDVLIIEFSSPIEASITKI